jgi:four helix bundle protein
MINDLKDRTKRFAVEVICFCSTLPTKPEMRIISNQLMRASTSVGANYRAACRSKSKADFLNKLSIVEEEADESGYWLELLENFSPRSAELLRLKTEAGELVAIMIQSKKTARASEKPKVGNSQFEIRNSQFV